MNIIQGTLQSVEVGRAAILVRLFPLLTALVIVLFAADLNVYRGLNDTQSMDNAQLARQIARGKGFVTEFLRPHAVSQLRDFAASRNLGNGARDLFPADKYPPGVPRTLPDTYNSPGYPYVLAGWFALIHPEFDQTPEAMGTSRIYAPERWIPLLNQVCLILTAVLVFMLGRRLFDQRVAWFAAVSFLATELVWKYSLTALSTSLLMLLFTALVACLLEVVAVGEACFASEERSFGPAWIWGLLAVGLLIAVIMTWVPLLILLVPVVALLFVMPRASMILSLFTLVVVVAAITPWFIHLRLISGSFFGSNAPLVLHGSPGFEGNQIYCAASIPSYEQVFSDSVRKQYEGFRWNFEHGWSLLGSNVTVLFFAASILHQYRRRRTRLIHWFLFFCLFFIVAANNFGSENPGDLDAWNAIVVLFPCLVVFGSAYFFILLDRLALQLRLLNNLIVTIVLVLTAAPLALTLTTSGAFFNFPPYVPPYIKSFAQMAQPDEWVTTDMPWATAWYGDRASLWLPDALSDFQNFHDNVCPTGMLILTPVSWSAPFSALSTGEYREWFPFATGQALPPSFPLPSSTWTGKFPDYRIWSDHARWKQR